MNWIIFPWHGRQSVITYVRVIFLCTYANLWDRMYRMMVGVENFLLWKIQVKLINKCTNMTQAIFKWAYFTTAVNPQWPMEEKSWVKLKERGSLDSEVTHRWNTFPRAKTSSTLRGPLYNFTYVWFISESRMKIQWCVCEGKFWSSEFYIMDQEQKMFAEIRLQFITRTNT